MALTTRRLSDDKPRRHCIAEVVVGAQEETGESQCDLLTIPGRSAYDAPMARFLDFPNPVNDVAARTVAAGVVLMCAFAIVFRQPWVTVLLAYGFLARVASGPRFSPLGLFATRVAAPRLPKYRKLVPGPPKRFAQGIGAVFTVGALVLWLTGHPAATYVVLGILIIPASLEAALGFCVGCEIFRMGIRIGIVPASACEECADLWGPAAAARRAEGSGNLA